MNCPQTDSRSGRVVFVCQCLLNANAKVCGLAKYPGILPGLVESLAEQECGLIQLPCPELIHLGPKRWWQSCSQYDTPAYRGLCSQLALDASDLAGQYLSAGYSIAGVLGVEGSPSCGVEEVYDSPAWGGRPESVDLSGCRVKGTGLFVETLKEVFADKSQNIPFVGIPSDVKEMNRRLALLFGDTTS